MEDCMREFAGPGAAAGEGGRMHFLPASSLFLSLSSSASVRRPHRETWEDVEGTELDEVRDRLRRSDCTDTSAVHAAPPMSEETVPPAPLGCPSPLAAVPGGKGAHACMITAADGRMHPSSSAVREGDGSAASPQSDAAEAQSHGMQQHHQSSPEAACGPPSKDGREGAAPATAATSAAATAAAAASWENSNSSSSSNSNSSSSSSSRRGNVRGEADATSTSSLRRAPSTFSTSLPTAPYERLLFQRQQQRRLLQQQATLRSFPSLSSTSGSLETLAAALQDKRQRQQQQLQEQQQNQHHQEHQEQQHEEIAAAAAAVAAPSSSEACMSPSQSAVVAELKGPSLPPALRLQLLQQALWTSPTTASSSSLGRSERKWWSMDDRNLEAFMFSHHRTFLRRLGRYFI
ncbi:hypothetical protein ACSSS7_006395 [Eimeria intestinalis]